MSYTICWDIILYGLKATFRPRSPNVRHAAARAGSAYTGTTKSSVPRAGSSGSKLPFVERIPEVGFGPIKQRGSVSAPLSPWFQFFASRLVDVQSV